MKSPPLSFQKLLKSKSIFHCFLRAEVVPKMAVPKLLSTSFLKLSLESPQKAFLRILLVVIYCADFKLEVEIFLKYFEIFMKYFDRFCSLH